jgi:hypothetical protein
LDLAANPDRCAEMGRRSRAALEERFSNRFVADGYLDAIRSTVISLPRIQARIDDAAYRNN